MNQDYTCVNSLWPSLSYILLRLKGTKEPVDSPLIFFLYPHRGYICINPGKKVLAPPAEISIPTILDGLDCVARHH